MGVSWPAAEAARSPPRPVANAMAARSRRPWLSVVLGLVLGFTVASWLIAPKVAELSERKRRGGSGGGFSAGGGGGGGGGGLCSDYGRAAGLAWGKRQLHPEARAAAAAEGLGGASLWEREPPPPPPAAEDEPVASPPSAAAAAAGAGAPQEEEEEEEGAGRHGSSSHNGSGDDAGAPGCAKTRHFLYVGVMTAQKYLSSRALAAQRTWARSISGRVEFFSSQGSLPPPALPGERPLPVIALPGVDDSYPPQKKSFMMLKYMHDHYLDAYEWFMRADDDVYIKGEARKVAGRRSAWPWHLLSRRVSFAAGKGPRQHISSDSEQAPTVFAWPLNSADL